jgi:hypothetical protein
MTWCPQCTAPGGAACTKSPRRYPEKGSEGRETPGRSEPRKAHASGTPGQLSGGSIVGTDLRPCRRTDLKVGPDRHTEVTACAMKSSDETAGTTDGVLALQGAHGMPTRTPGWTQYLKSA